jgi:hypothetical protein
LQASCCWCRHCAGIVTNVALASLPSSLWHGSHHGKLASAQPFVLVALALLPSSSLRRRQHCKLASAQAQGSCNTRWRHCQHCPLVVADIEPASSPLLRGCICPHCTGVAALGTPALPPASQTGICPVMMQLRPIVGEVSLSCSTLSPVASSLYPESAHSDVGLWRSGLGSNGVLLALHWCPCAQCTGRGCTQEFPATQSKKEKWAKYDPWRRLNCYMPHRFSLLLLYSDCIGDTFFPINFRR